MEPSINGRTSNVSGVPYIYKRGKKLKCGYTTGSCAAGAAKAAALMLLGQKPLSCVHLDTPAGIPLRLEVRNPNISPREASCCIVKDAGDDADVTHGLSVYANVRRRNDGRIAIRGGAGIGTITKPGFWGERGEPAINPVPRRMISDAVRSVDSNGWDISIAAPQALAICGRTFNSKLGIEGGISILGTTGIVEPMSEDAWLKTIFLEIDSALETGGRELLLYLGNYGKQFARTLELDLPAVKISNFIGEVLLYCREKRVERVVLVGHIGKMSKLSLGIFNTHSKVSDARIEAFVYHLALAGASAKVLKEVSACTDTEAAVALVFRQGYRHVFERMAADCARRIVRYVGGEAFRLDIVIYSMNRNVVGRFHD